MEPDQPDRDTNLILRKSYLIAYFDNVLLLKYIVTLHDDYFPPELISYIIDIIWNLRSDPVLDTFLMYNKCNDSTLSLRDIVNSVSHWADISIFKTKLSQFRFYIKFKQLVFFHGKPEKSIYIPATNNNNNNKSCDSPFFISNIDEYYLINSQGIYVGIDMNSIMYINHDLYAQIGETAPELSQYYIKDVTDPVYIFNDNADTSDIKRQIMINWMTYFDKQLKNKTLFMGREYRTSSSHMEILNRQSIQLIY